MVGHEMVTRAKDMSAHLGQDAGKHILKYRDQIPMSLRGKIAFVFTDWRHPLNSRHVSCIYWLDGLWVQGWIWLDGQWGKDARVLRHK